MKFEKLVNTLQSVDAEMSVVFCWKQEGGKYNPVIY